jgi:hypothetical protein
MKVNVIRASNPDMVMKMSLGGFQTEEATNYFRQNYDNFISRVGTTTNTFVNAVKNVYNYVTNTDVINSAKHILTRVDTVANDRVIYPVDIKTIHRPGLVMRRYIMANPILYTKYENDLCSGYEDEWNNNERDVRPEWRDDYLRVMDGVLGDEKTIFMTEENPLSSRERFIVQNAWDTVTDLIASGIDPTDFNEGEI